MNRFVLFSRRAFRDSGAGYWSNENGWTTLAGATVFAEHEASDAKARLLGAVRVPAPPLRLESEDARQCVEALEVGGLVWVHDPQTAALQVGGAPDALMDGHYTYLGSAGGGLASLAYPDGARFTMPYEVLQPSPLSSHIDTLRQMLGESPKLFAAVQRDAGRDWLQVTLSGVAGVEPPTGWQCVREDAAGVVLRSEAPVFIDWPMGFAPGDVVAFRDDDDGACSAVGVWLRQDENDPEHVTLLVGGAEQEVPRMCVFATPAAYARQAFEATLARYRLADRVAVSCTPPDAEALHVVRLHVQVLPDDAQALEASASIAEREGYGVRVEANALVLERALDPDAAPWMSEADVEAWHVIQPSEGGYFDLEDVHEAPACTVWAVIEEGDETLTLRAGFRRFDAVLGYVRTERPWVTECERAIWAPGAPLACVPRPAPAAPLPG